VNASHPCEGANESPESSTSQCGPEVVVIVVTYNSEDVVAGLIDSLSNGLEGSAWRLVIVDNNSRDATIERVRDSTEDAEIVEMGHNAGYAAAINCALATADARSSVLILNPDVHLAPGCLGALREGLEQPGVGITVPRLHDLNGNLSYSLRREPTVRRALVDAVLGPMSRGRLSRWSETVTGKERYGRRTVADWATGAVMLISAECLDQCGRWDESFFLYSEETDFCLRARDLGFRTVLAPSAQAAHLGGESRVSPQLWALLVVNRVRLYRRRHSLSATVVFWFVAVLREASRAAMGRTASRQSLMTLLSPERARDAASRAAIPG
jgi:N-acetylglucosaminyl-diphospho-decaprenol L-rhamnosyltransferase